MKLFVYGTLKRQYGNNVLLAGAKLLGEAVTQKPYVLFNCGFPKAVPFTKDENSHPLLPIQGEVYEINDYHLNRCDSLEGHPDWYIRNEIKVILSSGKEETAMIYEMPEWQPHSKLCNTYFDLSKGWNIYKWYR